MAEKRGRPRGRAWEEESMNRIRNLYESGSYTLARIADEEKLSVATVVAVLDHLQVPRRGRGQHSTLAQAKRMERMQAYAQYIASRFGFFSSELINLESGITSIIPAVEKLISAGIIIPGPACDPENETAAA